jgi:GNAT superfamily N-acetyltransferase
VEDFGFDVRIAWRRDDPGIAADAIDFWARNDLLPPGVDPCARAKELVTAVYRDDELAAVSTAILERIDFLGARFAILRSATGEAFRRSHAQFALASPTRNALCAWSLAHPEEKLAGTIGFVERNAWGDLARQPVWPRSSLEVAGYDQHGRQIRVHWFDHFRFESEDGRPPMPAPTVPPELLADVELRLAWRRDDPRIEADAIDFWQRLALLPAGVDPAVRAKDVVLAVYKGDRIVAVTTAELGILPQVRARLAMIRGAVDPQFRRSHIGAVMLARARETLESWADANPDERIAGLGAIVEARELGPRARQPYAPLSRFGLIGFTPDGRQIRISWFQDFRLDV